MASVVVAMGQRVGEGREQERVGGAGALVAATALLGLAGQMAYAIVPGDRFNVFSLVCPALCMLPWFVLVVVAVRQPVPVVLVAGLAMACLEFGAVSMVRAGYVDFTQSLLLAKPVAQLLAMGVVLAATLVLARRNLDAGVAREAGGR